jgi:hypothetical protein
MSEKNCSHHNMSYACIAQIHTQSNSTTLLLKINRTQLKAERSAFFCCSIVDSISNNNGTKTEKNHDTQLTTGKERNAMLGPTINNIINSILLSFNTFSCSFKTSMEHANSFLLSASYFPNFFFHARIKN